MNHRGDIRKLLRGEVKLLAVEKELIYSAFEDLPGYSAVRLRREAAELLHRAENGDATTLRLPEQSNCGPDRLGTRVIAILNDRHLSGNYLTPAKALPDRFDSRLDAGKGDPQELAGANRREGVMNIV